MPEPIVFISHFRIKEGRLDVARQLSRENTERMQAEKPRTLAFLTFVSEAGTEMTIVHVFPDAESMDVHFQGSDERSKAAYESLEPQAWEIYGAPSYQVVETMRREAASAGVALTLQPDHPAGFLRLEPA